MTPGSVTIHTLFDVDPVMGKYEKVGAVYA